MMLRQQWGKMIMDASSIAGDPECILAAGHAPLSFSPLFICLFFVIHLSTHPDCNNIERDAGMMPRPDQEPRAANPLLRIRDRGIGRRCGCLSLMHGDRRSVGRNNS